MAAVTAALTALQTIVVAGFGYSLTGKLELTLKERQATVSHVTAMATLVNALYEEGANSASRDRAVQHLAMYGRDAIWPLMIMAAGQNPFPAETPLKGLSFIALQYPSEVCAAIAGTLSAKTLVHEKNLEPITDFQRSLSC